MPDLGSDEFWSEYQKASDAHRNAIEVRLAAERKLITEYSQEALEGWNTAHRNEAECYEQLKAAERVVWAKYKGESAV